MIIIIVIQNVRAKTIIQKKVELIQLAEKPITLFNIIK